MFIWKVQYRKYNSLILTSVIYAGIEEDKKKRQLKDWYNRSN